MAYKLFVANFKRYHLDRYLKANKIVDWRQTRTVQVGDFVFMYVSAPYSSIKYLFRVKGKDIPFSESFDDHEYWNDQQEYYSLKKEKFIRLEFVQEINSPFLSLENLKAHGLSGAPQGGRKLEGTLLEYILSIVNNRIIQDEYIARICWNTNFWRYPSGSDGKSHLTGIYEFDHGFGHEEWLFDDSKIINGYHYSFLQQLNRESSAFKDPIRLHLFTIKSGEGKMYLGYIDNFEYVSKSKSLEISRLYQKNGWLDDMICDVRHVDGDCDVFKDSDLSLFNCRFKFSDVHVALSNLRTLSKEDENTKGHRYGALMKKKHEFKFIKSEDFSQVFSGINGDRSEKTIEKVTSYSKTEYDPVHKKMQNAIRKILLNSGIYSEVKLEVNRVDIVGMTKSGKFHFFEIKTYAAKQSIREAIGQILEYNHYPDNDYAEKMVIICPFPLEEDDRKYLGHLREMYHFRLYFRYYSIEHKLLGEEE